MTAAAPDDSPPKFALEVLAPLTWPKSGPDRVEIQCAGSSYVQFQLDRWRISSDRERPAASGDAKQKPPEASAASASEGPKKEKRQRIDLLSIDPDELTDSLTHYDILDVPMTADADAVKRAYHKACLRYHPDKTGRGEEDYVFLAVKAAFDTLSDADKRRSYDSTVDFDDSIPPGNEGAAAFYGAYGPAFERNMRFAMENRPGGGGGGGSKKGKRGTGGGSRRNSATAGIDAADLGDDSTPIDQVNAFYEYWTHFESWRDFTLKATESTEHDVEAADCREEKRWMAKAIDRKAKAMKREEMARINLLVERAMAADPRLRRQREAERLAKEGAARERREREEREAKAKKEREAKQRADRARRDEEEREKKAKERVEKEREKKSLRKGRQLLRKLSLQAYESKGGGGDTLEQMNDDVELLCEQLSLVQIESLTERLGGEAGAKPNAQALLKKTAQETRDGMQRDSVDRTAKRNAARKAAARKEASQRAASAGKPFTKEELSALAKAVKKYPPGGANRWETIAGFINNLLSPVEPRTKEECIAQYNKITSNVTAATEAGGGTVSAGKVAPSTPSVSEKARGGSGGGWSDEQDRQLQEALKKYPNTLDKNERWASIAKSVNGKSKKECVQRFKAIRDAIKNKG